MKIFWTAWLCGVVLAACSLPTPPLPAAQATEQTSSTPLLLVFYDRSQDPETLLQALEQYGAKVVYHYTTLHGLAIRIPAQRNTAQAMQDVAALPGVLSVRPDSRVQLH